MKKQKKDATPSASTLMRQARTAKPREAKRLRTLAALMRREERGATKARPAKVVATTLSPEAKKEVIATIRADWDAAGKALRGGIDRTGAQVWRNESATKFLEVCETGKVSAEPTVEQLAADMMKLARKKNGAELLAGKLRVVQSQARYTGASEEEHRSTRAARADYERAQTQNITGFMMMMASHIAEHGDMPSVIKLNGYTAKCIIDALGSAGYTSRGKK